METAPLKSFATKARIDLLKEVAARVLVVLAENSLARVESAGAVRELEEAIARDGQEQVVDRVAYTWFNRIIALRFMDANGYTASGVVSPGLGRTSGQPEVFAEAKAGTFDDSVVSAKTQEVITSLLNGTRPSQDAQGEAYGLLLEAYCRYWHKAMPFMFEREGDYTELLMPTALLAADSVRDRAVKTLTEDVCREVEVIGWLYQFYISDRKDEVFDGFKKNKKAGAAEIPAATQLFTPHWIVRYLVENSLGRLWLLNNPSSRLVEQMDYYIKPVDNEIDFLEIAKPEEFKVIDPAVGSGHMLTHAFDLLYAIYTERGYDPAEIPGLILEHNLYGTEIDPRAGALAAFALTMKAAAKRKLFLKNPVQPNIRVLQNVHFDPAELDYLWSMTKADGFARADADELWNAFEHADTFGSLIQPMEQLIAPLKSGIEAVSADGDLLHGETLEKAAAVVAQAEYLSQRYSVVVANPPYMGSGNMSARLSQFARSRFGRSKNDLFAMFIERSMQLSQPRGRVTLVTQDSWMFLAAYAKYRVWFLEQIHLDTLAHLGSGSFESIGGEVVATVAFAGHRGGGVEPRASFIRAAGVEGTAKADVLRGVASGTDNANTWLRKPSDFRHVQSAPLIYWASDVELAALSEGPFIGDLIQAREGMATGDNGSFLRRWSEVSRRSIGIGIESNRESVASGKRWFPYQKGGSPRRWYGNFEFVVDWENDGKRVKGNIEAGTGRVRSHNYNGEYGFQPGFSWSGISGDDFAVRHVGGGFMFDGKGPMAFANGQVDVLAIEGFLNSSTATRFMRLLAPRLDFRVGHVLSLPVRKMRDAESASLAARCVELSKQDWDEHEESLDFATPPVLAYTKETLERSIEAARRAVIARNAQLHELESALDLHFSQLYYGERVPDLTSRPPYREPGGLAFATKAVRDLVSYAVGCIFGRYSLEKPGLILADQGSTLDDYLAQVPSPSFMPDRDNVIPIVDGEWFEDDIVARFRQFLRAAFGDEHFEENLRFVTESLEVKDIRDYFVKSFYDDHVKRYRKRPIYWLFRSPKGSFSALIYLHRYNPSTVSTVLTVYLREFISKLEANLEHQERVAAGLGGASARDIAAAQKEADRIRKVLVELRDYEHDILFPQAGQQIELDLDDGVLVNYQKLGAALKDIGLKKRGGDE
ncbi:Eco57I restriction-modification methylase [Microcella alkaliphila]|uniref:site-specific DNA-methyltransferase (adenine-specific) n=1 Tax=Microcella alkaliphila TaxID=279828 RepID=A0A4Q7U0M3_9MICO|nr:BREX-1 system adenine-specific DNA-methyltransferase PglX [Microcella alkaliphila]RZT66417.1 Eco57I restriction-modification methylase [Microcella alkaliphila]